MRTVVGLDGEKRLMAKGCCSQAHGTSMRTRPGGQVHGPPRRPKKLQSARQGARRAAQFVTKNLSKFSYAHKKRLPKDEREASQLDEEEITEITTAKKKLAKPRKLADESNIGNVERSHRTLELSAGRSRGMAGPLRWLLLGRPVSQRKLQDACNLMQC
jgi:hypothetical protein